MHLGLFIGCKAPKMDPVLGKSDLVKCLHMLGFLVIPNYYYWAFMKSPPAISSTLRQEYMTLTDQNYKRCVLSLYQFFFSLTFVLLFVCFYLQLGCPAAFFDHCWGDSTTHPMYVNHYILFCINQPDGRLDFYANSLCFHLDINS